MSASPAPATPPTPAKPEVPKATKTLSARNFAALADDETIGDVAQTMKSIDAAQAANARDIVDGIVAIADTAVGMTNVGSAFEAIVGETVSGQALTNGQRVIAGVSVAVAPLAIPFKILKGGKAGGSVANVAKGVSKIEDIATPITAKFGNFKCYECAEELVSAFKNSGIKGTKIEIIGDTAKWGNIISDTLKGKVISTNGKHVGVRVGDIVYDNIHKNGIPYKDWRQDFHSPAPLIPKFTEF